jgi:hypothetical protein
MSADVSKRLINYVLCFVRLIMYRSYLLLASGILTALQNEFFASKYLGGHIRHTDAPLRLLLYIIYITRLV